MRTSGRVGISDGAHIHLHSMKFVFLDRSIICLVLVCSYYDIPVIQSLVIDISVESRA